MLPFLLGMSVHRGFWLSLILTAPRLFGVGAWRTRFTGRNFFRSGLEMFLVGALAFAAGWAVGEIADSAPRGVNRD